MTRRATWVAVAAGLFALLVASPGATRDVREGGTFRGGVWAVLFDSIDASCHGFPCPSWLFDLTCASLRAASDTLFPPG